MFNKKIFGIILLFIAIVYFISPIDFVPDIIPFLGWIDDLMVFAMAILFLIRG